MKCLRCKANPVLTARLCAACTAALTEWAVERGKVIKARLRELRESV